MGYIIAIVVLLILVPVIFLLLSRRTVRGGGISSNEHGVTRLEPSAEDTPTPGPAASSQPTERKSPPP